VTELSDRWAAAAGGWGAAPGEVERTGAALVARYAEPHRRYHTVTHLGAVLEHLFVDLATDPVSASLAAWYHDAVYDPRAGAGVNEVASAELAVAELARLGAPGATLDAVARLIGLTVDHRTAPGDRDGAVLCDADLAILGAAEDVYARYSGAVREEFGWLGADEWRAGRSEVLGRLLDRPWLFATTRGRQRWERRARANLAAERARLLAQP
jgi:predicted metal-dependent HD superfamily phosphohydrolase